jgi:hypothetical protein
MPVHYCIVHLAIPFPVLHVDISAFLCLLIYLLLYCSPYRACLLSCVKLAATTSPAMLTYGGDVGVNAAYVCHACVVSLLSTLFPCGFIYMNIVFCVLCILLGRCSIHPVDLHISSMQFGVIPS